MLTSILNGILTSIGIEWIAAAVGAVVVAVGGWLKVRSAKKSGVAEGRQQVKEQVEKADANRAKEIRSRVDAVQRPTGNRVQPVDEKPKRTGRGYRD